MTTYDVVVRGGTVIDGTGDAARTADVGIVDGVVVEVGRLDGGATRVIDADGALVTPGWVDIHTHYDGQSTWDERLAPSSWHGVTTVVMGNCGVGFAPVRPADHQRLIELMEGVEDIPGAALHEGLSWEWQTFAEYLDAVDRIPHDIDVAAQVPHGAVRLHVMGERGAAREPATPEEIAAMGRITADAVAAGALGFTTSRTLNHRTSRGEPTPTLTAARDELAGIAGALRSIDAGVLQVVSDLVDLDDEMGTFRAMMTESGRPLSLSIVQSPIRPDQYHDVLEKIAEANADGMEMRGQVAARAIGIVVGIQATFNPLRRAASFAPLADLPHDELVAALHRPEVRAAIIAERTARTGRPDLRFDQLFPFGDVPDYEPDSDSSVAAIAQRDERDVEEVLYDLLLADGGRALLYMPIFNYTSGDLDAVSQMLAHPHTVPGLSDGGAHVGTICDASFPTTLLAHWGRDRRRGPTFEVPWLVRQQTKETAATVGLLDRGVLAPGYRADLNVIDFEHLGSRPPRLSFDLPAGGKRLLQPATGYVHTLVAGDETYANGEATGPLPGRLVRGARPTPGASR